MIRGRRAALAAIGFAVLLACLPSAAGAATYVVTRADDPTPGPCLPADCSLREALDASNASAAVNDEVVVPASAMPYLVVAKALEIQDEVEVRGAGADQTVIEGSDKDVVLNNGSPGVLLAGLKITGGAGAIQNNGDLTLRRVAIEHNTRTAGGGGIQSNGSLTLESSFLGFNSASAAGGGIQANAPVTVVNSTITGNSSDSSAINGNDKVTITSSAVVSNTSSSSTAAGVRGSPLTVRDSIFAANSNAAGLLNCTSSAGGESLGGNVEDAATCATGPGDRPNVDPRLETLGLHGGTTLVYDLQPGSPAIDFATQCPPLDQRGVARPQGAACDSGPFELVPSPAPLAAPVVDTALAMKLGKGKLRLSRKGVTRVKLTCPADEANPPCRGTVTLGIKSGKRRGKKKLLAKKLPSGAFSIDAGRTQAVRVHLPHAAAERVRSHKRGLKVPVVVRARDAAGNTQLLKARRKIVSR